MDENQPRKIDIVQTPGPDWQEIATWAAGILASLSAAFIALVYRWNDDRFAKVESHLKDHCEALDKQADRLADHENKLTRLDVNIENINNNTDDIKDSIRRIHDKLDRRASG